MKVKLLSCVRLLATPWTAAYQAPPSMGFSRQQYWSDPRRWDQTCSPCRAKPDQGGPSGRPAPLGTWRGQGLLPAADRGAPTKGNQKLLQNRKKAEAWPEPKKRSSGRPLVPCEHSFSGKRGYLGPSAQCTPNARQNHTGAFTQPHRVCSFRKAPATHRV